jgi:hypothetical protein
MYDLPSSTTFGAPHHHMSSSSTSSLTGIGLAGPSTSSHLANSGGGGGGSNPLSNLIINYLPQDMNERELHSLFSPMGPIETCRVMRDFKVSTIQNFHTFITPQYHYDFLRQTSVKISTTTAVVEIILLCFPIKKDTLINNQFA